jgi:hypothetical protein
MSPIVARPLTYYGREKRKRGTFTEDEKLLLTNMSDAVNNVANALRGQVQPMLMATSTLQ